MKNNHLTSYDWLNALNNLELLSLHSEILTQLRSRGVIRTKNNPVGDYAEWLVSNALGMTLLSNSSAGADAIDADGLKVQIKAREVAIKWSAAPDMTPQTVLYRRPVAQFSNFQPKIVSSWLILALFQANFLISGRSRLCPYQLVNSNQVRQGE